MRIMWSLLYDSPRFMKSKSLFHDFKYDFHGIPHKSPHLNDVIWFPRCVRIDEVARNEQNINHP